MIHWHHLAYMGAAVCFMLAVMGVFGAGMASRQTTAEDFKFPLRAALIGVALIILTFIL